MLHESLFQSLLRVLEMDLPELPDRMAAQRRVRARHSAPFDAAQDAKAIDALVEARLRRRCPRGDRHRSKTTCEGPANVRVLEEQRTGEVVAFFGSCLGRSGPARSHRHGRPPDFQRRGLGEAMLRWALAWFREQGMRRAKLIVRADNAPRSPSTASSASRPADAASSTAARRSKTRARRAGGQAQGTYIKFGGWR